jgi:cytidylate kinase
MYRAATWNAVDKGIDVNDPAAVADATESMKFAVVDSATGDNLIMVNGKDVTQHLHSIEVDDSVSAVSAVGGVREILVAEQRRIAGDGEIVMVGRDIGTVVLPDAPLKVFLTASAHTRAIRRHKDFTEEGIDVDLEVILRSMEQRDLKDSSREHSPLKPADDAIVVDTDELSLEQVVDRLVALAKDVL